MSERPDLVEEPAPEQPVVRDKRRIDPVTGEVRVPAAGAAASAAAAGAGPAAPVADVAAAESDLAQQLAERTADAQRVQAEYANYRRRVDRDREAVRELALANVLTNLLPVLDDIGRAREHGELEGGFKAVAESLEGIVEKLGLQRFGAAGEPFDPTVHEALTHEYSAEVSEPTAVRVFQVGYRIGNRVLRPARVAVAEPAPAPEPAAEPASPAVSEQVGLEQ